MRNLLFAAIGLFAFSPLVLSAQGHEAPQRKKGTIWKSEVDELVDLLTDTARAKGSPAIGGDSVLATAKILAAMAKCHRRYYVPNDTPVATRSLEFLFRQRKQDGSFGDAETTAWVVETLTLLPIDGQQFATEVEQAQKWLEAHGGAQPSFGQHVAKVLEQVRADVFPQHLGADAGKQVAAWLVAPSSIDVPAGADALLQLVACQQANKALDKAQDPQVAAAAAWSPGQQKAFAWLMGQQKDGVFSVAMGGKSFPDPALTGFGLMALQSKPKAARSADEQATIEKGLRWLLGNQNEDGTFGERVPNYTTCVVVGALHKWGDPVTKDALKKAQRAILAFQNSESSSPSYSSGDRDYGSIGYGSSQRGDLSNLHFSLDALRQSGLPADHEAFQKALVFLQRTQNLKSVNDFKGKVPDPDREGVVLDARPGDDGGAAYYPGNSNAGYIVQPDGTSIPRSYGSMTYALLKSYTLAGVKGDDSRVQAAVNWIQNNWTLAVNPGTDPAMGEKPRYAGLFYYYMVLAQALDVAKVATVNVSTKDDKGEAKVTAIDWKKALRSHLESIQQPDGTWLNDKNDRWMEGMSLLCTCYAMTALERCQ